MTRTVFLDSFSGGAATSINPKDRTSDNVLRVLSSDPRVSTWDMSELPWLRKAIADLVARGMIREVDEAYPWLRYEVKC